MIRPLRRDRRGARTFDRRARSRRSASRCRRGARPGGGAGGGQREREHERCGDEPEHYPTLNRRAAPKFRVASARVPLSAVALALGAAFLHAGWNVLLAGSRDTRASTAGPARLGRRVARRAGARRPGASRRRRCRTSPRSAVLELCYFVLLARAYDSGEVSVVYPIARGSAPVVVLAFSAVALKEGVPAGAVAGIVLVAAGVLLVGLGAFRTEVGTKSALPLRDVGLGWPSGS